MRKLFLFTTILPYIFLVFQSCSKQSSKESVAPMRSDIINATIAPNEDQLRIENSGDVSISMQASHFKISQTEPDSKSGVTVYKYTPAVDYRGTDEVILGNTKTVINTVGGGCPNHPVNNSDNATSSTSYTTVKINITD